jgi:hypothetical protein
MRIIRIVVCCLALIALQTCVTPPPPPSPQLSSSDSCIAALVMDTYSGSSAVSSDWRLADLVDQGTYDQITHDASASAVIYGFPVGANYDDFKKEVTQYKHSHNEQLATNQLVNIAWTGLDPNSPGAYAQCLNTQVFLAPGLHAAVRAATASNIIILVKWDVPGEARAAEVNWTPRVIAGQVLPTRFPQGTTAISVARPLQQVALAGSTRGWATDAMILDPLPAPSARFQWVRKDPVTVSLIFGICNVQSYCAQQDPTDLKECNATTVGGKIYEFADVTTGSLPTGYGVEYKQMIQPYQGHTVRLSNNNETAVICGQGACGFDRSQVVQAPVYVCQQVN